MPSFGEWEFSCDRKATVAAYARADAGGCGKCSCVWCRNFLLVRDSVYPKPFLAFLNSVGVDSCKDGEVYNTL
jgi:hypothetical protein